MSKLMILAAGAGFSCAGQDLEATDMGGLMVVDVPDEYVDAALSLGLMDFDTESARLDAAADAAEEAAKAAAAARPVKVKA